jgi:hypothetical protein
MKAPTGSIPASDPNFPGYAKEFRSQVEMLKGMAKTAWIDSLPAERKLQEANIARFRAASSLIENELDSITFMDFRNPSPRLNERLVRVAVALYIHDKVLEFHDASIRINKDGLYSVLDSVREWALRLLSGGFFTRSAQDIISEYVGREAGFVAMAELCNVEIVPIQDAVASYQSKVRERLAAIVRAAGPGNKKKPAAAGPAPAAASARRAQKPSKPAKGRPVKKNKQ